MKKFKNLFESIEPEEGYIEYANIIIGISADEFIKLMWDEENEIFKEIMKLEKTYDLEWVSGSKSSTGEIEQMRKMNAPMAPPQSLQHIKYTSELNIINKLKIITKQLITKSDDVPGSDAFDVRERWDIVDIGPSDSTGNACQVRLSGTSVWSGSSWVKWIIESQVKSNFKLFGTNIRTVFSKFNLLLHAFESAN